MKNLKDVLTTICGAVIFLGGSLLTATEAGIVVSPKILLAAKIATFFAGAMIAYLTGKNPDGSTKTAGQVDAQNPK